MDKTATCSRFALEFDVTNAVTMWFRMGLPVSFWVDGRQVTHVQRELDGDKVTLFFGLLKDDQMLRTFSRSDVLDYEVRAFVPSFNSVSLAGPLAVS